MDKYIRSLTDNTQVEIFLHDVLQIPKDTFDITTAIAKIRDCSILLKNASDSQGTIFDPASRHQEVRSEDKRWNLRKQIVDELFIQRRLVNDDDIVLTKGGAKPRKPIRKTKRAYIITGLPASGKSGVANKVADILGGYILDSDYAKRKIPEYYDPNIGASVVHNESKALVFGEGFDGNTIIVPSDFKTLLQKCAVNKCNLVVPIIGDTVESVLDLHYLLTLFKYKINIVCLNINKFESSRRAIKRFVTTSRYVPIEKIFDIYGDNNPTLTYYKLRVHNDNMFESFALITSDSKNSFIIEDIKRNNLIKRIYGKKRKKISKK